MIAVAERESMGAEQRGDATDRVTQEVTPQGIVRYTYDAISQRLTMRVNAQPPVTYGYDANSQLSHVTQGTLSATLTHDALGRRTQLQRSNGVTGAEKGTGYFSGDLRGRPRGRSVESRPKVAAIVACQLAVPKGCCRFTQVRRAVSLCSMSGWR